MDAAPPYPGIVRAIVDLVFSPTRLFTALREKPRILVPLLALGIGTGVLSLSVVSGPMLNDIRGQFEQSEMSDEQREAILEKMGGSWGRVTAIVPALTTPILALAIAAVFAIGLAVARSLSPGPAVPFRSLLSLSAHIGLLDVLEFLLKLPLMFAKGTLKVYTSLALILPEDAADTRLFTFLNSFDLFTLWKLGLYSLGLAIVASRGRRETAVVVALFWVVFVLAKTALHGVVSLGPG